MSNQESRRVPIDEDKYIQEIAEDENKNIWRTDVTDLTPDTVIERNPFEIARDADRVARIQ